MFLQYNFLSLVARLGDAHGDRLHLVEADVRVGDQVELVLVVAAVVGRDERERRARRAAADVDAFEGEELALM